jgi:hypothetical protein
MPVHIYHNAAAQALGHHPFLLCEGSHAYTAIHCQFFKTLQMVSVPYLTFPSQPKKTISKRRQCMKEQSVIRPGPNMYKIPFSQTTEHPTTLSLLFLLYPRNVLPANRIPARHVLLHTGAETALFAAGDGRARFGDAALEAVFVDFLDSGVSI